MSRHPWRTDVPDRTGFLLYERVLREIRADMGHKDRDLGTGDLQRLYVTDVNEIIGPFQDSAT